MKKTDFRPVQAEVIKKIKVMMQRRDTNNQGLAKKLNVSPSRVTRMLDNRANLTLLTLGSIAEALDCDLILNLRRRDKKKMIGTSPEIMLNEIKELFSLSHDISSLITSGYTLPDKIQNLVNKYIVDTGAPGAILRTMLINQDSFDEFIKALGDIFIQLDSTWRPFYEYVVNGDQITLFALLHHPDRTEEEETRVQDLKARYYPGLTNEQILDEARNQYKKNMPQVLPPDPDNTLSKQAYKEPDENTDPLAGLNALVQGYQGKVTDQYLDPSNPFFSSNYKGKAFPIYTEDNLAPVQPSSTLAVKWPHQKESISFISYRGNTEGSLFYAYGYTREAKTENGDFYFVASVFASDGTPLNEIAIPKASVIHPIQETHAAELKEV